MSKPIRYDPCRGMPRGIPAQLRKALAEELRRMGTTYAEFVAAAEGPTSPEMVLKIARLWNSLTPGQTAAWQEYAERENMRGADPTSRN